MSDYNDPEIFAEFVVEAREHLDSIEPRLLDLEKNPEDKSLLDEIFRSIHSLKGASGFLGLNKINTLAHRGENVLDELRKGKLQLTPEIMDLILETTDVLRTFLDELETRGTEPDLDIEGLLQRLDEVRATPICKELEDKSRDKSAATSSPGSYKLTVFGPEHLLDFLEEAEETVSQLNGHLIQLEQNPQDEELINNIFRSFHNLKGNSGLIGYQELNKLTHIAENLLNRVRNKELEVSSGLVDLLLKSVDVISELLDNIDRENSTVIQKDISFIITELEQFTGEKIVKETSSTAEASEDEEDREVYLNTVEQQFKNIDFGLQSLREDPKKRDIIDGLYRSFLTIQNASTYMNLKEISAYAERIVKLIDDARNKDVDFALMLDLLGQEKAILAEMIDKALDREEKEKIEKQVVRVEDKKDKELERRESKSIPKTNSGALKKEVEKKSEVISTIRVDHNKLDQLMNLIGELIINRNRFAQIARELEETENIPEVVLKLNESVDAMARVSDALQDTIMQVRMVPVRSVFSRFPRLVRDLSRKSNKPVELITEGEETELDKSVIELIGDPLVHILRNSVDHGLESEEERKALGKPVPGKVWVRAYHKGNFVVIEVEDDGRGIDPEKVKQKAIEKGLLSVEEAETLDEQQARELIFLPGFSTAEKVTDVSGRGVGMDVVRNNIRALKGSVSVTSEVGKGTKFVINLPLTLAIIDALMVKVSGETFALPLDAVAETTKISVEHLSEINKRKAITLRGEVLALIELANILKLPPNNSQRDFLPVVVLQIGEKKLGLIVDVLLERQEIVIKSLGEYLGDIPAISGATIMGDGNVILILDPNELYLLASQKI